MTSRRPAAVQNFPPVLANTLTSKWMSKLEQTDTMRPASASSSSCDGAGVPNHWQTVALNSLEFMDVSNRICRIPYSISESVRPVRGPRPSRNNLPDFTSSATCCDFECPPTSMIMSIRSTSTPSSAGVRGYNRKTRSSSGIGAVAPGPGPYRG